MEAIPSLPFGVTFNIPVAKVVCGDLFSGLLTSEGDIYTWGWNQYGQLGYKDITIGVTINPTLV